MLLADYHVHALAHGEYDYTEEWLYRFLQVAREKGINRLGFAEHEELVDRINLTVLEAVRASSQKQDGLWVGVGLEIDYKPGREDKIKDMIIGQGWDFIIGSIHYIGEWAFDHPDYRDGFADQDIDELYEQYYGLVARAASSGLFDILGHLDLIKIWGHRPRQYSEADFVRAILGEIKRSGVVVEINTGGLRKPVQEIYPGEKLIEELFQADVPITFSSDAHHPEQVGSGLRQAMELAKRVGYRSFMAFEGRRSFPVTLT